MRNYIKLAISALMLASVFSCSDDIDEYNGEIKMKHLVLQAKSYDSSTRTALASDGLHVNWEQEDKIGFGKAKLNEMTLTKIEDTDNTLATFEGDVEDVTEAYAVYPAGYNLQNGGGSSNVITGIEIPQFQTAIPGNFNSHVAVMTAKYNSNVGYLKFHHICAFIKVTPEFECREITFKSRSGNITGVVNATIGDDGTATCEIQRKGSPYATILPPKGQQYIAANETYYIAVLPQVLNDGYEIYFTTDEVDYHRAQSSRTLVRAKVHNLGSFDKTKMTPGNGWDTEKPEVVFGGDYSVSSVDGNKAIFSRGNLQAVMNADGTVKRWQLAQEQYEILNHVPQSSYTQDYVVDLFGWTEAGLYSNATLKTEANYAKQYGINPSTTASAFVTSGSPVVCNWTVEYKNDSGSRYNWKLLTGSEWNALFNTRTGLKGGQATIGGVGGVGGALVVPDGYTMSNWPTGVTQPSGGAGSGGAWNNTLTLTVDEWRILEKAGFSFLPYATTPIYWLNDFASGTSAYAIPTPTNTIKNTFTAAANAVTTKAPVRLIAIIDQQ